MPELSVKVYNANASHPVVLVCEHASARIPDAFNELGLDKEAQRSHIAWDPGASAVARYLSDELNAVLVESTVSRLVYDCNRPPEAPSAVPIRSERYDIPGNQNLSESERMARAEQVYFPFEKTLANTLTNHVVTPIIVTVHSFTPIYNGEQRHVEIGVLHDADKRLADALLNCADQQKRSPDEQQVEQLITEKSANGKIFGGKSFNVQRNQPYAAHDGVTHTLLRHAIPHQWLNVMLEIRNDLIATDAQQQRMAIHLHHWIEAALASIETIDTPYYKGAV